MPQSFVAYTAARGLHATSGGDVDLIVVVVGVGAVALGSRSLGAAVDQSDTRVVHVSVADKNGSGLWICRPPNSR